MSKIHILDNDNTGRYKIVIHVSMINNNNSVDKSWKDCYLSELRDSILEVGTAPGNITQVEKDSIIAGNIVEIVSTCLVESGGDPPDSLDDIADKIIQTAKNNLKNKYKYYGYIQD